MDGYLDPSFLLGFCPWKKCFPAFAVPIHRIEVDSGKISEPSNFFTHDEIIIITIILVVIWI